MCFTLYVASVFEGALCKKGDSFALYLKEENHFRGIEISCKSDIILSILYQKLRLKYQSTLKQVYYSNPNIPQHYKGIIINHNDVSIEQQMCMIVDNKNVSITV